MTSSIFTVDTREISRINRNLEVYMSLRKVTEDRILTDKGIDLRIKLFRLFFAHRWAEMKKGKGSAILKNLTIGGKGIRVRLMRLISPWDSKIPATDKNGKALSMWQKLVAQEVMRRAAGIGILGVSFLGRRWRFNKKGAYLVTNKTNRLGVAATFEKRDGQYIISGFTPGLRRIADKYGILSDALALVSANIEEYLARKLGPEFLKTLHAS